MFPVLLSVGLFRLYSYGFFFILSWCVFSFLFWKGLRKEGISEEKIFDLTFAGTLTGGIFGRLFYVIFNWPFFKDSWLSIFALWVQPGLSIYGALAGGLATLIILGKKKNIRIAHIADAFVSAYAGALIVGSIGSLMDGTVIGLPTGLPWAVRYVGFPEPRHPVQIYEIILNILLLLIIITVNTQAKLRKWPYGISAIIFFFLYSVSMFAVEYMRDTTLWFYYFHINHWFLIALFLTSLVLYYLRGGGKEAVEPAFRKIQARIEEYFQNSKIFMQSTLNSIYEKAKKRIISKH